MTANVSLIGDETIRALFDEEAADLLGQLDDALPRLRERGVAAAAARAAHTLKGSAGVVGLTEVHQVAAALEAALEAIDEGGTEPSEQAAAAIVSAAGDLRGLVEGSVEDPVWVASDAARALDLLVGTDASARPAPVDEGLADRVERLARVVEALAAAQLRVGALVAQSQGLRAEDVAELEALRSALAGSAGDREPSGDAGEVLVVDDSPTMRGAHARMLRAGGFSVRTAVNGREALALLDQSLPDLVVTDLEMPVMGGFRLIEAVRGHAAAADVPILVVSSNEDDDVRRRCVALGAQGYVVKKHVDEARLVFEADRLVRA
jgi:CheY-like chemotaxis protein/HPt (histidine-containing phosphotransfer) domain-containing protein